jgi:hypothetical protein
MLEENKEQPKIDMKKRREKRMERVVTQVISLVTLVIMNVVSEDEHHNTIAKKTRKAQDIAVKIASKYGEVDKLLMKQFTDAVNEYTAHCKAAEAAEAAEAAAAEEEAEPEESTETEGDADGDSA